MRWFGPRFRTVRHYAGRLRQGLSRHKLLLAFVALLNTGFAQVNHIEAAARLLSHGQTENAEAEARQGLQNPATRALALAMLGTIRLQETKYKESTEFLTQALAINPHLVGARTSLGDAYLLQGKIGPARASFQEVLKLDPGNVNARFDLAKLEASQRNFRQSLNMASRIVPQLATSEEGILLLAADYGALGKTEELKALPGKWRQLDAPSAEASVEFANLLALYRMTAEAKEILDSIEEKIAAEASAPLSFKLGQAYLTLEVLDHAEEAFKTALSLNPDCVACDLNLGAIAERQGNTEKALAYLIPAKQHDPDNPEVLFQFGRVCLERNLLDDATPALARAVELKPDHDPYVYVLGSANVARGNLTKAASLFSGLLQKHPQDAVLNYAMGAVYYLMGKYTEAELSLKKSLQAQPDQVAAPYYLGLTYDAVGQDDQAVAVFRGLLKAHPQHAPSYVKLGGILLRQHQYAEAQQDLERAVSLDPGSVEAHHQLGMALLRLGRTADSDEQFAESRKLEAERRAQSDMRLRLVLPD
ncbi:MAG TPA: tetratricopeptide repeat protein [Terriglobales bacterium]|nr:tetratricopeptide repeat protein [Terriglobales bacterium]